MSEFSRIRLQKSLTALPLTLTLSPRGTVVKMEIRLRVCQDGQECPSYVWNSSEDGNSIAGGEGTVARRIEPLS